MIDGKLYIFGGQASKDAFELDEKVTWRWPSATGRRKWPATTASSSAGSAWSAGAALPERRRVGPSCRRQGPAGGGLVNAPRLIQVSAEDPAAIRAELIAGLQAPRPALSRQVPLRRARFPPVRGHHRAAGVLPHPHRGGHLRRPPGRHGRAPGPGAHMPGGTGRRQLREGRAPVRRPSACGATWRWTSPPNYLLAALDRLQYEHPAMDMLGVGLDFSDALDLPAEVGPGPRLLFYPGSSIGNFSPDQALAFLRRMHAACAGGAAADRRGPGQAQSRCWNPPTTTPLGVTAAFNRNLLPHLNRLASAADFALADWRHVAFFDATNPASRCTWRRHGMPDGALARRRAPLCRRRAHPHRKLLQVDAWRISPTC
jgi:L-histidine N-alpha-methyltransferase